MPPSKRDVCWRTVGSTGSLARKSKCWHRNVSSHNNAENNPVAQSGGACPTTTDSELWTSVSDNIMRIFGKKDLNAIHFIQAMLKISVALGNSGESYHQGGPHGDTFGQPRTVTTTRLLKQVPLHFHWNTWTKVDLFVCKLGALHKAESETKEHIPIDCGSHVKTLNPSGTYSRKHQKTKLTEIQRVATQRITLGTSLALPTCCQTGSCSCRC